MLAISLPPQKTEEERSLRKRRNRVSEHDEWLCKSPEVRGQGRKKKTVKDKEKAGLEPASSESVSGRSGGSSSLAVATSYLNFKAHTHTHGFNFSAFISIMVLLKLSTLGK